MDPIDQPAGSPTCSSQLPMDMEHESCLKQQLLRHAVQQEVDIFMENPQYVYDSLYLDFIYTQMREFPLLNCHEKAKEKLEELVLNLPRFLTVSQRASKHDQQNRKLRVFVAGTFHLNFRTPLERQEDRKIFQNPEQSDTPLDDVDPIDRTRRVNFQRAQQELAKAAESLFLELSQENSVDNFFTTIKNSPTLNDLPPHHQAFMRKLGKIMALNVERDCASEDQVSKLKRMYRLTPMKAIKGLLAVTNPVKLLQGLISLFLARPLGVNNLLQKITATATELKRSETLLSKAKSNATSMLKRLGCGKQIIEHIESYLQTHALPVPDHEHYVENDKGFREVSYESLYNVDFVIEIISEKIDVSTLKPAELHAIHQVLLHSIRVKEKRELVEMLGTDQVVGIIKELWTIFDEPITILCATSLGSHLERMLSKAKAIVKISEACKKATMDPASVEKRMEAYNVVLQNFQEDFYLLLHDIAKRDNGVFKQTFQWYINIIKCTSSDTLDVQSLLTSLSDEDRAKVVEEVNDTLEYQEMVQQGGKLIDRPADAAIRKLVPAFSEMVRARLPPKKVIAVSSNPVAAGGSAK